MIRVLHKNTQKLQNVRCVESALCVLHHVQNRDIWNMVCALVKNLMMELYTSELYLHELTFLKNVYENLVSLVYHYKSLPHKKHQCFFQALQSKRSNKSQSIL